jgi:hypothetical protein
MSTAFAVSTGVGILALVGLVLGVVVLGVVIALFVNVLGPAREIDAYARDILEHGLGIARNVDGVDELHRTHELGGAVPGLATGYLSRLGVTR